MKLAPFLLHPAFRSGKSTPWGGNRLRDMYGKLAPDCTGESLEMSVIPGLESTDDTGTALSSLISRYGADLVGTDVTGDFPLLLKLIDAKDRLSVQVHPDDAYAKAHENKLGKTEAWVILDAAPGAQLVYGVKSGATYDALKTASEAGEGIEDLMRFVPVKAGDVFYIPAGMVHAIGGGILIYEIQQSSDVTYRFYDWNRANAHGNKRPLHIRQALDVTRFDLQLDAARPVPLDDATCRREQVLDTPYFSLQRLCDCKDTPFSANALHFSVLTALSEGCIAVENGEALFMKAGQSVFIPANCPSFRLTCVSCLLAAPGNKAPAKS